jgi:nitrate/TMAO reductase-like tetraheme cytochrome c subunit
MIQLRRLVTIGSLFVMGGAAIPTQAATLDGKQVPLNQLSAESCKDCHKAIYKQWKGSMHANSTALKDPIHGALYRKLIGDPSQPGQTDKKGNFPVCLNCHAPNAARDTSTKLDAMPAYNEGVSCVSCHSFVHNKGAGFVDGKPVLGLKAYEVSDQLQGPMGFVHEQGAAADALRKALDDEGELNPHLGRDNQGRAYLPAKEVAELDLPLQGNTSLQTSNACLGCHDKMQNVHGVPLCATGDEYDKSATQESCQSCHMASVKGVADHSMGGGHSVGVLKRAVKLDLQVEPEAGQLAVKVQLHNKSAHNVPTGAPFRNMYLKLSAFDVNGKLLWQNFQKHPMKEDPQAFFVYALADKEGKPAMPPMATQVVKNTRLQPYERRALEYRITADNVKSVRAELYFNLLSPGMVKKMKALPDALKAPKRIGWSEVQL